MRDKIYENKVLYLTLLAILLSVACILFYLESIFITPLFPIPGAKLGIANLVSLVMIYTLSWKEALLITILRVIIVNFILGTFLNISFFLGLFGGIMSTIVMGIVKNTSLSLVTNSVLGAITHNLTQLLVVIFFVQHSGILYYAPFLILFGIITGSVNGIIGRYVIKSLEKILGVNDEKK